VSNGVVNREINRAAGKVRTLYRLPSNHSSPHVLTTTLHRVAVAAKFAVWGMTAPVRWRWTSTHNTPASTFRVWPSLATATW
jgi:hypothetical protein